ncbi:hypothetical protein BCR36DRAFT_410786 [Piromyces finnis]|uniref:Uncharacterized protein n=1 Tax=Piromyces finnis TaxID=1754191 RepID=A0A1Y1VFG7_9FUNG|nr:hypothetical protein BCR36DRAFT_410786 [Piromyces finnis]|eukprot:ORX54243.1 hypothetical protein BCR36DRAFT_410786 [Piromyces finnis]
MGLTNIYPKDILNENFESIFNQYECYANLNYDRLLLHENHENEDKLSEILILLINDISIYEELFSNISNFSLQEINKIFLINIQKYLEEIIQIQTSLINEQKYLEKIIQDTDSSFEYLEKVHKQSLINLKNRLIELFNSLNIIFRVNFF